MEAITVYNQQPFTRQEISPALFADFVAWIDRSEKTTRTYINNLRQFAAWMAAAAITAPTRQDIIAYRDHLTRTHKATTVAAYLRTVCQFFKWTASAGLYPNIAENIHGPKLRHDLHKKDALTVADVQTIERSIEAHAIQRAAAAQEAQKDTAGRMQRSTEQGKRLYAIYLLAVNAGLRTVEISRANVKDMEIRGGQACLWIWGKGHSEPDQRKPLAPEVAEAVADYLRSRTDKPTGASPLFVSTGNRSGGQRIATTTISTMLKKAMQEAGYNSERITAHSLRHTAGTAVQQLTGDLYQTQKYMRHSNPATTELYLHNDADQRQEAQTAQRLYDLFHTA